GEHAATRLLDTHVVDTVQRRVDEINDAIDRLMHLGIVDVCRWRWRGLVHLAGATGEACWCDSCILQVRRLKLAGATAASCGCNGEAWCATGVGCRCDGWSLQVRRVQLAGATGEACWCDGCILLVRRVRPVRATHQQESTSRARTHIAPARV